MSRTRTMRRYALPAAIATGALVVAGGVGIVLANADDLPEKTAEELLAAVQNSDVQGLSGTVEQTADLALPTLGSGKGDLASLSNGSHTLGVWYSANDKLRVAMQNDVQETNVIRDGADVYTWNSQTGQARHETLPEPLAGMPLWSPSLWSATPGDAAEQAVGASPAGTKLSTDGTEAVAGRDAYGLIMAPTDETSLVDHVRLSVDAETGVPLSTQVFAKGNPESPALEVAFSDVEFAEPDDSNFTLDVPDGTEVEEGDAGETVAGSHTKNTGEGWTTVGASQLTQADLVDQLVKQGASKDAVEAYFDELPEVSGGKLMETSLFSVLIGYDGAIYYGAVTPEALTQAAAG